MDPLTLAAIAAPFVAKGAEAFSNAAGDKLGAKVGELCQAVINKFKGNSDAEETPALAQKKMSKEEKAKLPRIAILEFKAAPDAGRKALIETPLDEVPHEVADEEFRFRAGEEEMHQDVHGTAPCGRG